MSGKIKGITLTVGGDTSGLRKELSAVNKETASIQKELKEVDRSLKLDPKNTELLTQKQKLLADAIEATEGKLDEMRRAQEKADEEIKNGTEISQKQYRMLQREISNTEAQLKNLKSQSEKTNDTLSDVKKPEKDLKGLNLTFGTVAKGALGFAAAGTAVAAGLSELEESTREYREDLNKLKAAFVSAEKPVESAKKAYSDYYAILGESDRAVESVSHLAELTKNQEELTSWTTIAAGVTAKFGDSLPIEGLTEAANETAKVGNVTGVLADALNWVGISEDAFNEKLKACNSEQERASLITETLKGAYQGAADTYTEMNASVMASREAQLQWNEAMAKAGEAVAPIKAKVTEFGASLLNDVVDLIDTSDEITNQVDTLCEAYETRNKAIDDSVIKQLAEIETAKDLFKELEDLAESEEALTGAKRNRAEYIVNELKEAIGIEIDLNGDLKQSLIDVKGSFEEAIKAKQAEILLEGQEEKFTEATNNKTKALEKQTEAYNAWQDALEAYDDSASNSREAMTVQNSRINSLHEAYLKACDAVEKYSKDEEKYMKAAEQAAQGNSQAVIDILNEKNKAFITAADVAEQTTKKQELALVMQYENALDAAYIAAENYKRVQSDANKEALEMAITHANNCKIECEKAGMFMTDGFIVGVSGKKYEVKKAVEGLVSSIPEWARKLLDINSPSKVIRDEVGEPVPEGLAVGIIGGIKYAKNAVGKLIKATKNEFTKADAFDINSRSGWGEGIGKFIDEGLANGIFDNINLVKTSFKELFTAVEEEHEDLTEEEKKYNSELERIRAAGTESANKDYLEKLKNLADEAKERRKIIRDTYEGMVEDVQKSIENLQKDMESYKKDLSGVDLVETVDVPVMIFNGKELTKEVTRLTDLGPIKENLAQFRDNIINLREMGIDESMLEQIKLQGAEKGGLLAQALLDATPEEREQFIKDFKEMGELSGQVTAEVYKEELQTVADDTKELFKELNPDFLKIGENWGTVLGGGIITKLNTALQSVKNMISSINFNYDIPVVPGNSMSSGGNTVIYNTEINQTIEGGQALSAYDISEETRRTMENINNQAVLS